MTNLVETTTGRSVPEVIDTLRAALARRGIHVFAVIDHAAAAREAGLDLPLRIRAWSDGQRTHVAYRDIRDLAEAFDVASEHEVIGRLGALLPQLVAEMTTGD